MCTGYKSIESGGKQKRRHIEEHRLDTTCPIWPTLVTSRSCLILLQVEISASQPLSEETRYTKTKWHASKALAALVTSYLG
jgi:hypothetical protein